MDRKQNSVEPQTFDQWRQQRVLVLGSGGAARAVVAGFALAGARVTIANRTHTKAAQLATQFNGRDIDGANQSRVQAVELENIAAHSFTIIVNCTSVGMTGSGAESVDPLPISFKIKSDTVVMDTVYRPRETPLLQRARAAGAVIVDGTEMFLRQAALQFELFMKNQIISDTTTDNVPHKNADSNTNSRIGISPNIHLQINEQCLNAPIDLWRKLLNHALDAHS